MLLQAGVESVPLACGSQTAAQVARANGHDAIAAQIDAASRPEGVAS